MRQASGVARRVAPIVALVGVLFLFGQPRGGAGVPAGELPPELLERQQQAARTLSGYASGPWDVAREICIDYEYTDDGVAVERALRDAARDGGFDPRSIRAELQRMRCQLP